MPILAAEPAHFPEGLFAEAEASLAATRQWWVLHTRPQQEKSLARDLFAPDTFLPPTESAKPTVRRPADDYFHAALPRLSVPDGRSRRKSDRALHAARGAFPRSAGPKVACGIIWNVLIA